MAYSSPHNYDPYVKALAVSGSNLYAGGSFDTAGGVVVNNIAKWDGQTWSPLGAGLNGGVFALASSGGDLYAGGALFIGGPSVVKWDGSSWSTLGSGMGGATPYIYALALSGGDLYAGGWFTMADGKPASGVAKWDGKTWLGLGSGLGGDVNALAVSGGYLYAGGDFTFAGGKPSPFVAKAIIGYHEPRISADPTDQTTAVGSRTSFFVGATGAAPISHQWRFNQENLADGGRISGAGSDCLTIAGIQTSDTGNYTVVVTNAYGSVTSRVAVLTVLETSPPYLLLDYYYPIYVGNEWLYDGTDWDGNVAQTLVQLDAVSMPVTCYRGESSPVAYSTNLTRLYSAYGASTPGGGFDANDTWYDYVLATGGWGMWGNDDDPGEEEVRVDGGLFFADPVVLGGVYAKTNDAYVNGDYVGPASMRMEVLSQTSVTVPAGTFPDCLHLRFTMAPPGDGPQMYEEWWAKGMGMVKHRGLSGAGANEQQDLIRATVTNPHTPPTLGIGQSNGQPQLRVSGTLGSRYALEYTASLVPGSQWQGLVTNTLTSDPLTVPLNIPEGEAQRFYRVRWVP